MSHKTYVCENDLDWTRNRGEKMTFISVQAINIDVRTFSEK